MRLSVLSAVIVLTLSACDARPPASTTPPPPATPSAPAPTASAAKAADAPVAAAPAKEVPEGECGDQSKVPADQRIANTARWTTASEQDSFGFDVFRGDTEKGEFKKLTEKPVLGAGTSDETHKYEYRDDSIDPCKDYWYYIEEISNKGTHEKISPVFRAPAKRRAVGSPGAH
jgi:hypothetical protein